jgi:membrane associated rhomboid family serine protease
MLDYILARMIPVRDVIPSRTAPAVTVALLAAMAAACLWPAVREWWLPWAAHGVVLWLTGGTLEDRLGHDRFAAFAAGCAFVAFAAPLAAGHQCGLLWTVCGAMAGLITGYVVMFPRSRILAVVPVVVGIEVADVPAWTVFGLWTVLQVAVAWAAWTWSAPADPMGTLIGSAAGAAAGATGSVALRRPERMRVDWWDPPTRPS